MSTGGEAVILQSGTVLYAVAAADTKKRATNKKRRHSDDCGRRRRRRRRRRMIMTITSLFCSAAVSFFASRSPASLHRIRQTLRL